MSMIFWLSVAGIGAILSLLALCGLVGRFRSGEVTLRFLAACIVGFLSFVSYALVTAFRPDIATGWVAVLILLPAFLAILVVIRERRARG